MSEKKKNLPARGWHIPAAVCALLLTAALFLTQAGCMAVQVMTSRGLHERVALAEENLDTQMARIGAAVDSAAAEYGFDPEPVKAAVTREKVKELNRQAVAWWTGILSNGEAGDLPSFDPALKEVLSADEHFVAALDPMTVNTTIQTIEARVSSDVRKSVILYRDQIIKALFGKVENRANLPELTELVQRLPMLGGVVSLLLMGLIALMLSRKIQLSGQYIGGAFSACGLLMILEWVLIRILNLRESIGEASEALMNQYAHLERILSLELLGGAAVLMLLGALCMVWAEKARRKAA